MELNILLKKIRRYLPPEDVIKVTNAYNFAATAHVGQNRNTGEPYITHPLAIASMLADLKMGTATLIGALLHDVLEDTPVTLQDIKKAFGEVVAQLVEGVTKLSGVRFVGVEDDREVETLRKMFLAMAQDLRVVLIKLADRLHNMQTLEGLIDSKRERFARETLEIFVPLADRLGIWRFKWQLEDLAFRWLFPQEFEWVKSLVSKEESSRERYVQKIKKYLMRVLALRGIKVEISGRAKHYYSLYKKLLKHDRDITRIYDLIAVRVVVSSIDECYQVLGIVHSLWPPLTNRIKDFIAVPKVNGYRSLHTTVFALDGKLTEIQIRDYEMDQEAKFGIAAHWAYGQQKESIKAPRKTMSWIQQLSAIQQEMPKSADLEESLKIDVFQDRIFVFTPKGTAKDLPLGATPVDFAYAVHSEIGHRCVGAKVNNRIVPLDFHLGSGDVVDIMTSKNGTPSRDWLKFTKTSHARNRIRAFFKNLDRDKNIIIGKQILDSEVKKMGKMIGIEAISKEKMRSFLDQLNLLSADDLYLAIGEGSITIGNVIKNLFTTKDLFGPSKKKKDKVLIGSTDKVMIAGKSGMLVCFANCCNPKFPDKIIAYITRGKGATIHQHDCMNLNFMDRQRLVGASWEGLAEEVFPIPLVIRTHDRIGMISDISGALSKLGINIFDFQAKFNKDIGEMIYNIVIEILTVEQLEDTISSLSKIPDVIEVRKK